MAMGGICLALTVLCLWLASFLPAELSLYAVASVFVGIMIIEGGVRYGVILYVASIILCFILVPNKLTVIPYIFFFGVYGIIKFCAEKIDVPALRFVVKVAIFAGVFAAGLFFFRKLFFDVITLPDYSTWVIFAAGIILFVIYDYIYSGLIALYRKKIKREKKQTGDIKLS